MQGSENGRVVTIVVQTSRQEKDGTWSELTWFETTVLGRHNKTDINNRMCPLCKNGVEDEHHFIILWSSLNNIRNKMFANILSIFPSFHVWLMRKSSFIYLNVKNMIQLYCRSYCEGSKRNVYRRNELTDNFFMISVKDIFVYCLKTWWQFIALCDSFMKI